MQLKKSLKKEMLELKRELDPLKHKVAQVLTRLLVCDIILKANFETRFVIWCRKGVSLITCLSKATHAGRSVPFPLGILLPFDPILSSPLTIGTLLQ